MRSQRAVAAGLCASIVALGFAPLPHAGASSPDGWGSAVRLELSDAALAYHVRVATNDVGQVMYTWTQTENGVDVIHARTFDFARGWGEGTIIQADRSVYGDGAFPVVDAQGNAMAVWIQYGVPQTAWAARYDAKMGWEDPVQINSGGGDADSIRVAIDGAGNVFAIWQESDGVKNDVWSNRYVAGTGWGVAARIETGDGGAVQSWIAAAANGEAFAVWAQRDGTYRNTYANRFSAGAWGTPTLLETTDLGDVFRPLVAIAPDGRAVAGWSQFDGSWWSSWSAFYTPGTGWTAPVAVKQETGAYVNVTHVGIDGAGNATILYRHCVAMCVAWAARSNGTSGWQGPVQITAPGTVWTTTARLAVNAHGNVAVISLQQTGSRYDTWVSLYSPAGGWQPPTPIETDNSGVGSEPWIAMDAAGDAFAGWDDLDFAANASSAWANVYRAPGTSTESLLARANADLEQARNDLAETNATLHKTRADLNASTANVAALSGQVATLSIVASIALFAALAAIGLVLVQASRARGPPPPGGPKSKGE